MDEREKKARENCLKKSEKIEGIKVEGYDFDNGLDWEKIIDSFESTGMQASKLGDAIKITKKMIEDEAFIYLGYTSNMVSSGLRDVFRFLIKNNKVGVVVTTAGAIEEDIAKCLGDFYVGDFNASGKEMRKKGINRAGNVFIPNDRYCEFEDFFQPILEELWQEQEKGNVCSPSEIIWKLGEKINDERSICYWAWKNKIRIYCPAIVDGAIGDNIYFFKHKRADFKVDIAEDMKRLIDSTFGLKKAGAIILGGGVSKHQILNAHLFRDGVDYAVFINTGSEYDGSDSGANPEEAVSWGKILPEANRVKVFGDATILFPILVAKSFVKDKN